MASTNYEEYHADQHTSKPISQAHCDSMTEDILDRGRPRVATDYTVSPTVDDTAGIVARLKGGKAIGEDPLPNELSSLIHKQRRLCLRRSVGRLPRLLPYRRLGEAACARRFRRELDIEDVVSLTEGC